MFRVRKFIRASLLAIGMALFASAGFAAPRVVDVRFARGESAAVSRGSITGRDYVDYRVRARAGQILMIRLRADRDAASFNLLQAGREQALFLGSEAGRQYRGVLPADSVYSVRVYLARAAARRNEKASYSLEVSIGAPQADSPLRSTRFERRQDYRNAAFAVSPQAGVMRGF